MSLVEFLQDLAGEIRARVGDDGEVVARGAGLEYEIEVSPRRPGPCGFSVYLQGEDEITVQLGVFTTVDVFSRKLDEVAANCRDLVQKIIAGAVSETVWVRDGAPCRAVTRIGSGSDLVTWTTSMGLCRRAVRQPERQFEPYASGLSGLSGLDERGPG